MKVCLDNTIPYEEEEGAAENNIDLPQMSNWLRIWSNGDILSWQENNPDTAKVVEMLNQYDQKPERDIVTGSS